MYLNLVIVLLLSVVLQDFVSTAKPSTKKASPNSSNNNNGNPQQHQQEDSRQPHHVHSNDRSSNHKGFPSADKGSEERSPSQKLRHRPPPASSSTSLTSLVKPILPSNQQAHMHFRQVKLADLTVTYPTTLYSKDFDDTGKLIGHLNMQNWRHHAAESDPFLIHSDNSAPLSQSNLTKFSQTSLTRYQDISRSQEQEDIWLYEHWFYGKRGGIILESGALDGIKYSNSYLFEKFASWQAIHIEADLVNYQRLKMHRRDAININAGLCNASQSLHFVNRRGTAARGFYEFMTPIFLEKFHPEIFSGNVTVGSLPVVPCMPLSHVASKLQLDKVDIWILDVEGAEESVLQGVDFNKLRINAISMECDDTDPSKNERKISTLRGGGFDCVLHTHNCFCKHKEFKPTSKPDLV